MCLASARHRMESMRKASAISGLMKKVNATGAGSARPVVSMMTWSNFFARSFRVRRARTRSPRTVQHTQPLSMVMMSSASFMFSPTRASSMDTAPNSFSMTAMSLPCSPFRMWFTSVVFPAPRKPVTIWRGRDHVERAKGEKEHEAEHVSSAARPSHGQENGRSHPRMPRQSNPDDPFGNEMLGKRRARAWRWAAVRDVAAPGLRAIRPSGAHRDGELVRIGGFSHRVGRSVRRRASSARRLQDLYS